MYNKYHRTFGSIICLISVFLLGFYLGLYHYKIEKTDAPLLNAGVPSELTNTVDFAPFWTVWKTIDEKFIYANKKLATTTPQEKVWGAIQGLTASLNDPHTIFLTPEETSSFKSDIAGNFEGIGVEIGIKEKILTIISPLKGTPAERAGVLAGDKIIEIDGKSVLNISVDKANRLIRGKNGTPVELTILRKGKTSSFKIVIIRDTINIPSIETKKLDGDIFLIQLFNFSASSPNDFRTALREFVESNSTKLIIDLRGNPGGYLEASVDMAGWFIPAGKLVVAEDFGGNRDNINYKSRGYNIFNDKLKIAIIINNGTASAAEILASALHKHNKAILVGTESYGKGSVQELINITPETSLKITVARWLTAGGQSISDGGLKPDYVVNLTEDNVKNNNDTQLKKAIEVINK